MSFGTTTTTTEAPASPFLNYEESALQTTTQRIGIAGLPGTGKSHILLSIFAAIRDVYGVPPEKTTVYILDCDNGGMAKLVRRGLVPEEYRQSIRYAMGTSWDTTTTAMSSILAEAPDLLAKNGPGSTWLLVDNVYKTYRWARDQYCLDVFGMSELERAKAQRRKALANPDNKRGVLPTFDQQIDYGTITPMYLNQFWEPIMMAGINIMIAMPTYEKWDEAKDGTRRPTTIDYRCQSQIEHDLDDIIWLRTPVENPTSHLASLRKSRTLPNNKQFKSVENLDMTRLLKLFTEGDQ